MHRGTLICLACVVAFSACAADAEVIDRIVAVVDNHIITLSDVRQERNIQAGLGEQVITDDSALIQQLVEHYLIETQMGDFPEAEFSEDEVTEQLKRVQTVNDASTPALRDAIRRRIRMSKYFDVRFRQFIRPSDEEIQKYYVDVFVPAARARGLNPVPPLDSIIDAVRENVVKEKLNHEVNIWLEAIRRRSFIEIVK
jgi:hypothetical protein